MLRFSIIFLIFVAYLFSVKIVTSEPTQNVNVYQNESEITTEVGNQLIRDKRGLDSFPAWDPNRTTALATAIAFLMCTTPPPKEKGRCKINVQDLKPEHSLILDPSNPTQFLYPDDNGYMEFEQDEPVLLSCTTTEDITFAKISESVSKTFLCVCEDQFAADNHIYSFQDLGCTKVPRRHVRQDDDVETYSKYQIGFQTTADHFLNLIDVYYDSTANKTAYVQQTISKHKNGGQKTYIRNVPFGATYHPYPDVDSYYTADQQIASFRVQLYTPSDQEVPYLSPEKMLNRGHLVPTSSMVYTAASIATNEHLNIVPQFELINARNWDKIEDHAVTMATTLKRDLVVVTGTHDQIRRPISRTDYTDMYLYAVENGADFVQRVPIPLLTYKIIMDVEKSEGVVYVTVNDPEMKVADAQSYYLCDEPFIDQSYMKPPRQWDPKDPKKGYSYICRVDEFLWKTGLPLLETPAGNIQDLLYLPRESNVSGASQIESS